MDGNLVEKLLQLDRSVATALLSRMIAEDPAQRAELLQAVRERAPGLYTEWLAKAAGS